MTDTRFTSLLPALTDEEYQSLKAGIREFGVLTEILRDEYGTTIDGAHRERAIAELRAEGHKIQEPPVRVLPGLDDDTKTVIVYQIHRGRRHMDIDLSKKQRHKLIEAQLLITPTWSDRQIAEKLGGMHNETVGAARQRLVAAGRLAPQQRTVGADGKSRPAKVERGPGRKVGVCSVCDREVPHADAVVSDDGVWHRACAALTESVARCLQPQEGEHTQETVDLSSLKIGYCNVCGVDMLSSDQQVTVDGALAHAGCHQRLLELEEEEVDGTHQSRDEHAGESVTPEAEVDEQPEDTGAICQYCGRLESLCYRRPIDECVTFQTIRERGPEYVPTGDEPCSKCGRPRPFCLGGPTADCARIAEERRGPAPEPPKPIETIRVETQRQAEKLRDLAEAGRLGEVKAKGINAAHKQLREQRRHEEISEHAAAVAVDAEQLRVECMDALEFLRSLETGSVDMIWTDPPYYIASRGGGTKVGDSYATFDAGGEGWDDAQWADEDEFLGWLRNVVVECNRVLKATGNLVMCMDRFLISHLVDLCRVYEAHPHGMRPRNLLAWNKTNAAPNARGNFDSALELAVWAVAGPQATFRRPAFGQCSPVWAGPFVSGPTRERWPHPTAKPVEWIQSHLEVLSTPGQLVVDPFGGSGATVEAALRLGRRVIANDRAAKYANMCRARGAAVLEDLAGDHGWVEAIPCAGCRLPINGDETEETGAGRMHAACAITWRDRDAAKADCHLCGREHTANEGGIGDYGACCFVCTQRAWSERMKPTRPLDVTCPTCNAVPQKRCKAGRSAVDTHDARFDAAKQRQQADFSKLVMEVPA